MTLEDQQLGPFQQLEIPYAQILDYSSKEYTATLVSSTHYLQTYHSLQLQPS